MRGRITVVTELADQNGHSVIVPEIVEGHGVWQNVNVDTNLIASVYGQKNVIGDMKKHLRTMKCCMWIKKEAV